MSFYKTQNANNTFSLLVQVTTFKFGESKIYEDMMLTSFLSLFQSIFSHILCQASFTCFQMKTSQYTTLPMYTATY